MAHYIDAMGKACPQPVILAKQALDAGQVPLTIDVDNPTAVENLKRMAASRGVEAQMAESPGRYSVTFQQGGQAAQPQAQKGSYGVFIGKDWVGDGDHTLGGNLMKMFLYTLSQSEDVRPSVHEQRRQATCRGCHGCDRQHSGPGAKGYHRAGMRHLPKFLRHCRQATGGRCKQHV